MNLIFVGGIVGNSYNTLGAYNGSCAFFGDNNVVCAAFLNCEAVEGSCACGNVNSGFNTVYGYGNFLSAIDNDCAKYSIAGNDNAVGNYLVVRGSTCVDEALELVGVVGVVGNGYYTVGRSEGLEENFNGVVAGSNVVAVEAACLCGIDHGSFVAVYNNLSYFVAFVCSGLNANDVAHGESATVCNISHIAPITVCAGLNNERTVGSFFVNCYGGSECYRLSLGDCFAVGCGKASFTGDGYCGRIGHDVEYEACAVVVLGHAGYKTFVVGNNFNVCSVAVSRVAEIGPTAVGSVTDVFGLVVNLQAAVCSCRVGRIYEIIFDESIGETEYLELVSLIQGLVNECIEGQAADLLIGSGFKDFSQLSRSVFNNYCSSRAGLIVVNAILLVQNFFCCGSGCINELILTGLGNLDVKVGTEVHFDNSGCNYVTLEAIHTGSICAGTNYVNLIVGGVGQLNSGFNLFIKGSSSGSSIKGSFSGSLGAAANQHECQHYKQYNDCSHFEIFHFIFLL